MGKPVQTRELAIVACRNMQLCAGLQSGIEAILHDTIQAIWPQLASWNDVPGDTGDDVEKMGQQQPQ